MTSELAWPGHVALMTVLEDIDAHLAQNPGDAEAHVLRGCFLRDLGRDDEAVVTFQRALIFAPEHAAARNHLGIALHRRGRRLDALALFEAVLADEPHNVAALVNAANIVSGDDPERAFALYEAALEFAPELQAAHEGLCALCAAHGERERAEIHRDLAYAGRALQTMHYHGERWPIPALVLCSTDGGNLYAEQMLSSRYFQVTKLFVQAYRREELPPHHIVVNAIADADRASSALSLAREILTQTSAPLLNDASRVAATSREAIAQRLRGIAHVRTPRVAPYDASGAQTYPLLLRAAGHHMGRHFRFVSDAAQAQEALEGFPAGEVLAIEFIDTQCDGVYRKYRAMVIDGAVYPLHLAVSHDWKVHYFSSQMETHAEYRDEERRFLEDMPGAIGANAVAALAGIASELALEYAGIDFALDDAGNVVVFEANAAMAVIAPEPDDERFAYRGEPAQRVIDAMLAMVLSRCGPTAADGSNGKHERH